MSNQLITHSRAELISPRDAGGNYRSAEKSGIRGFILLGLTVFSAFAGGSVYWASTAQLDGAVIAPASFVVDGNRKTVQHLDGGIVSDLLVREGDYVAANQVLLRMDSTESDVNVNVLGNQLSELYVRRARLLAEVQNKETFHYDFATASPELEISPENQQALLSVQKNLFNAQLQARHSEEQVIAQRIIRFNEEIEGLELQRAANDRQMEIAATELIAFEELRAKGLTPLSRVNGIKREMERLRGADAQFTTLQARAANQIEELKLGQVGQERLRREAVTTELAAIETQISSIGPQHQGARAKRKRIAVIAPVSGRIVDMKIYTKGGVIKPGEPILDIVPATDDLIIEARVETADIEKLHVGQSTRVRLTGFDQAKIPEAVGEIVDLSADSLTDERSGKSFYTARVQLDAEQPAPIRALNFVPGMPADVFVNTGSRTAISYLMQPLNDRLVRTFVQ
ncbi:MAG: HlyD family type I secretion periplasmic adaptor subunit [Stappiaceae bacterium]